MRGKGKVVGALALLLGGSVSGALAQGHAHQHGVVHVDVSIDGTTLDVALRAPLDALLGFEHRPRRPKELAAADALREALLRPPPLVMPDAAGRCTMSAVRMDDRALQPAPADAPPAKGAVHADLHWRYTFGCEAPQALRELSIGLFDAHRRITRVTATVVGPDGQFQRSLRRPQKVLRLAR